MENIEAISFKQQVMPSLPAIETVARRLLSDEADVRDAVQDTLLRLWNYRSRLADVADVKIYCISVARNVALGRLKQRKDFDSLENMADVASPERLTDDLEAVETALQSLSLNQQRVIRLRGYNDMEVDEIAAELNLSVGNVRQLLSRGRRQLKKLLK